MRVVSNWPTRYALDSRQSLGRVYSLVTRFIGVGERWTPGRFGEAHMCSRAMVAAIGLILAIALHTAFNALIIGGDGSNTLMAFFLVWLVAVIFFALFEILKYAHYRNPPTDPAHP